MQPVLKGVIERVPARRAGERLLQPLFCGAQERWRSPPDSRSQGPSTERSASIRQNDIAGKVLAQIRHWGLVASVDLKDAYFTFR